MTQSSSYVCRTWIALTILNIKFKVIKLSVFSILIWIPQRRHIRVQLVWIDTFDWSICHLALLSGSVSAKLSISRFVVSTCLSWHKLIVAQPNINIWSESAFFVLLSLHFFLKLFLPSLNLLVLTVECLTSTDSKLSWILAHLNRVLIYFRFPSFWIFSGLILTTSTSTIVVWTTFLCVELQEFTSIALRHFLKSHFIPKKVILHCKFHCTFRWRFFYPMA